MQLQVLMRKNLCNAGACTRLELALERPVLWCACRHHIYELVAKAVWNACFPGPSVCPGEKIIQDFHSWWMKTDAVPRDFTAEDRPDLLGEDNPFEDCIDDLRHLSQATRAAGKSSFQRGDYEELMELLEVNLQITFNCLVCWSVSLFDNFFNHCYHSPAGLS